jgi:[acyl-carrier-protein] S-malonyltransferase
MSLAILCPGQGGQHPDMFAMVTGVTSAENVLAWAQKVLGIAPLELMVNGTDIYRNRIAQPLVCAVILARWEALRKGLPAPRMVLGYSVGELAAHAIAGTIEIETCLKLAVKRAELMDEASPLKAGLIGVLGLNQHQIQTLCVAHKLGIAIVNDDCHFVVGGASAGLKALERDAQELGARISQINVSVPAHTHWLKAAAEAFGRELKRTNLNRPKLPVLAGIDGRVVRTATSAAETLASQIAQTLQWRLCIEQAMEMGVTVLLELGPGNSLTRIARDLFPGCNARSLDEFRTLDGALAWMNRALGEGNHC